MADDIRVNGNLKSWGSLQFRVAGERIYGFTNVTFADKRERVKGYSMARHHAPYGRSAGKYSTDPVKVTGWADSVQALREAIAAQSADGLSYGNVLFQGLLQYIEPDESEITVEFDRLVWTGNSATVEEAPDPLKEDFELDVMFIRRNGLVLFDGSEGMP